jgi:hypothetical protein
MAVLVPASLSSVFSEPPLAEKLLNPAGHRKRQFSHEWTRICVPDGKGLSRKSAGIVKDAFEMRSEPWLI